MDSSCPVICFVDNKSLHESIYSTKLVDEKRLRLDIAAFKQVISQGLIRQVNWCPAENQLADVLTKRGANPSSLLDVIQSGRLSGMGNV